MKVKSESEVAQSCPTLRDPMDCSLPGSSVHGIFQARVLEWGAIAFSEVKQEEAPNTATELRCEHYLGEGGECETLAWGRGGAGGDASRAETRALRVGAQRSLRTRGRAGDEEPARRSGGSTCVSGLGTVRRQPRSLKASRLCACTRPFAHPLPVSEGPAQTAGAEYRPLVGKLFVALL